MKLIGEEVTSQMAAITQVVADEVRRLAHRTTEATGEIAAMVREIQAGTNRSVAAMDHGKTSVEEGPDCRGAGPDGCLVQNGSVGRNQVRNVKGRLRGGLFALSSRGKHYLPK